MSTGLQSGVIVYPESDGQPMTESDPTRDYLIYSVEVLRQHFQGHRNVYVSGNLFIYYREGDPKSAVSPDVFVVFGVSKRKRRSYKAWQEGGRMPAFVLEITSSTTKRQDEVEKAALYAQLGVQEYFQYDPTGDYLAPQLKGRRLSNGAYEPIPATNGDSEDFSLSSDVLGLDLRLITPSAQSLMQLPSVAPLPRELRFYDPRTGTRLLNYEETEQARQEAEQARDEAEQARDEAEQARDEAEQARRNAAIRLLQKGLSPEEVAELLALPLAIIMEMVS